MWEFRQLFLLLILFAGVQSLQSIEPGDTLYNQPYLWLSDEQESLPEWLFNEQTENVVIAVSDPCMKPEAARKQAIQRAIFLFSLQQETSVKILSDYFSSTNKDGRENIGDKILTIGNLQPSGKSYSYQILNEYTSLFGELYVQLAVSTDKQCYSEMVHSCASISEMMLSYSYESNENIEMRMNFFVETTTSQEVLQTEFSAKGNPENLRIRSLINGLELYQSQRNCRYNGNLSEIPLDASGSTLHASFWSSYMATLTNALLTHSFSNIKVKSVNDMYVSNGELSRELSRQSVTGLFSIKPDIKGVVDNTLLVKWSINPIAK